jgi:hypothetical protein
VRDLPPEHILQAISIRNSTNIIDLISLVQRRIRFFTSCKRSRTSYFAAFFALSVFVDLSRLLPNPFPPNFLITLIVFTVTPVLGFQNHCHLSEPQKYLLRRTILNLTVVAYPPSICSRTTLALFLFYLKTKKKYLYFFFD